MAFVAVFYCIFAECKMNPQSTDCFKSAKSYSVKTRCSVRMAIIANSIEAIDRVLETFGFQGELDDKTPRAARVALFYRGELRGFLGDITRRVGYALRKMRATKAVQGYRDKSGAAVWTASP
jgi:hypothetical protein